MPYFRMLYDDEADVAYLVLNGELPAKVDESRVCEEIGDPVETILDLDASRRITGIELRNASRRLTEGLLSEAERLAMGPLDKSRVV